MECKNKIPMGLSTVVTKRYPLTNSKCLLALWLIISFCARLYYTPIQLRNMPVLCTISLAVGLKQALYKQDHLRSLLLLSLKRPCFFSWLQVQSFLLHFWQGMPPHMLPVLGSSTVVNIVGVCDSILYKAISGVLMPTVLQALPDRSV